MLCIIDSFEWCPKCNVSGPLKTESATATDRKNSSRDSSRTSPEPFACRDSIKCNKLDGKTGDCYRGPSFVLLERVTGFEDVLSPEKLGEFEKFEIFRGLRFLRLKVLKIFDVGGLCTWKGLCPFMCML